MTALAAGLSLLLHAALLLGLAPLLAGVLEQVQARLLGRAGRPVVAPYHDLRRAWRKQPVVAESATVFSRAAPGIVVSAVICAALLVPSFTLGMATAPFADLLVVLGLLALARGALLLAALDCGTALGGMAAARAATQAALAVPAVVAIAFALALLTGSTNIDRALGVLRDGPIRPHWASAIALGGMIAALTLVAVVLAGRRPAEQPGDRFELAMGHDALLLDYSGADLGLLDYAGSLQLLVWLTLLGAIAVPIPLAAGGGRLTAWAIGLLVWAAKTSLLAAALAAYETTAARMPVPRVAGILGTAVVLAALSVVLLFATQTAP